MKTMSDELILDALDPPDPATLVNDLKSVGAVAVGAYVLRRDGPGNDVGIGTWTAAHVAACLAAGIGVFGIIVPGNNPLDTDPQTAMSVAVALGIPVGVMVIDIENFSEPRTGWVAGCITELSNNHWFVARYGDVSVLAGYAVANGDWVSHGYIPVVENQLFPMPALPAVAGVIGDQYTVGVVINGHSYDGSVFDSSVVDRMGVTIVADGFNETDREVLSRLATDFFDGTQSSAYDGSQPVPSSYPNWVPGILNAINAQSAANGTALSAMQAQLNAMQTAIDKLTGPAASLAPHHHGNSDTGPAVAG